MLILSKQDGVLTIEEEVDKGNCLITIKNCVGHNIGEDTLYEFYELLNVSDKLLIPKTSWLVAYDNRTDIVSKSVNKIKSKISRLCLDGYYIVSSIRKSADRKYSVTLCKVDSLPSNTRIYTALRKVTIDRLLKEL